MLNSIQETCQRAWRDARSRQGRQYCPFRSPISMPQDPDHIRAFSRSLPMALMRAREAVMDNFRPLLQQHQVTEQQWRVLRALQDKAAMSASELSQHTLISLPSLSRILKGLAARRLISRHSNSNDQRRISIQLLPEGKQVLMAAGPESERIYREIALKFGESNLDQLYRLLDCLADQQTNR